MKNYTTKKAISKLSNRIIAGWALSFMGLIWFLSFLKDGDFDHFSDWGSGIQGLLTLTSGLYLSYISNKKIKPIKGIELIVGPKEMVYKTPSQTLTFNAENRPKSINITAQNIEIDLVNTEKNCIPLESFELSYEDMQELKEEVNIFQRFMD